MEQRLDEVEVEAAHRRAESTDTKNDLIPKWEGQPVEQVAAAERGEYEGDGENHVADAHHVSAPFGRDGLGEQGVEANREGGERDAHQ